MGFPQSVCKTATSRIQINFNLATEFLLAQPILVQRARDKESARNLTNSSTSGQSTEAADATIPITIDPSRLCLQLAVMYQWPMIPCLRPRYNGNAGALFQLNIRLLQNGPLYSDLLEASFIPSWLASALLVAKAILVHEKSKPACEIPNAQPIPEGNQRE
ncbi:hypothetical protein BY996DRAFT_6413722 [Phakopsora pachyrhizi]|nr:hypothetical protein BY996DRAFT_6413722 [Phakopsora pachyrhizi]